MSAPRKRRASGGKAAPKEHPDTSETQGGEGKGDSQDAPVTFGGLTPAEASRRAAQARAEKRERLREAQAQEEGTTQQKIQRAFDGLTQKDWNDAVKSALGSATGMQSLTRLLDRVDARGQAEGHEEETAITPAQRSAILASLTERAQGGGIPSPSTSPAGETEGEAEGAG